MPRQEVEEAVTNMLIIVVTLFKFLLDIGQFMVAIVTLKRLNFNK